MHNFHKLVTKKNILLVSSIPFGFFIAYIIFTSTRFFSLCYDNLGCQYNVIDPFSLIASYSFFFVPLFLIALIIYFMRTEVFDSWIKFAIWWVPLTAVLSIILPSNDQSQSIGMGSTQGIIVLLMTLIFTIVSLIIIIAKWNALKGKNSSAR